MTKPALKRHPNSRTLPKALSGIQGLDEITGGGLPRIITGERGEGTLTRGDTFIFKPAKEAAQRLGTIG